MSRIYLSKYFSYDEMVFSQTAARRGIENIPPPMAYHNLELLCKECLYPIREAIGEPVYVTSGYRDRMVNIIIGGAPDSDHLNGQAGDIVTARFEPEEFFLFIIEKGLPFHKLINEFGRWNHVAWYGSGYGDNRQIYRALLDKNRETMYIKCDSDGQPRGL